MSEPRGASGLALSTIWRSSRLRDGAALLQALEETGLLALELEYRVTEETFSQMRPALRKGALSVRSVHNYFPVPDILRPDQAGGDAFPLSCPDPDVVRLALRYSLKTIELASDLGARAVVLHLGRVEIEEPMEEIKRMYREGLASSQEYGQLLSSFREQREARKQVYLDTVRKNLETLARRAEQLGVLLGLENRYYFREIPTFEEMGTLLREFSGAPIGYWHDVGHAAVQENLGWGYQQDWLEAYGGTLVGIHLHDVTGYEDHLAPLQGEVRFETILASLNESAVRVLELRPEVPLEAVLEGIDHIERLCTRKH
jgi:sugar phosphate isomerase/epimerase